MQQPLKNKTVLVTRSTNQAEEFITQLNQLGAKTIALPLIETKGINQKELKSNISDQQFNWIIFTSPNAVNYFFETVSPGEVKSKIAVVGSKTKDIVEEYNLNVDFMPSKFTAKKLAKELPLDGRETIFIPRSSLAKDDAITILKARNCNVKTIAIYENTPVTHSDEELNNLFTNPIDYITFASGSTINSFLKLGVSIKKEKVICIGPETAKVAKQNNITVTAIANPHTIDGMIVAIKKSLTS